MTLSTHVLDAATGRPADGMDVLVELDGGELREGRTDADGRIRDFGELGAGTHRIRFDTGAWFADRGVDSFYPEVVVAFEITDAGAHHHVPLLLSPYAYSTYRGS
jgi:5-hydroxyisourate hydrolase